jgi:1-acyl-sn-glycerol-3-phosphate acyltransferase
MPDSDRQESADAGDLADALLAALEEDAENRSGDKDLATTALVAFRRLGIEFVRRYNRLDITAAAQELTDPVLFVANHGFGGIFDLNVFAVSAAFEHLELDRDVTILTHQLAWTLGVGRFIEPLGARPASPDSARDAFARGEHVAVFPGGDIDAAKSWEQRNSVTFGGRSGFARLALDADVPIVPIVTAGAGESLFVLSSGQRLARALRLDTLLRVKAAPVSVSLPWGFSVGAVGMLPYFPLPTKLVTRVLPAMTATDGEASADFAARVETAMQTAMTDMTTGRRPVLG